MSIKIVKVCLIYNHFKLSSALPQDNSKQPCDTELELIMGRGVSQNM